MLPQPVLIIGTYDKDGKPNAMNAAWGGTWDMHEIIISLASHATTDNLEATGEFTVAFATRDTLVAADFVGIVSARNDAEDGGGGGRAAFRGKRRESAEISGKSANFLAQKTLTMDGGYVIIPNCADIVP